MPWWGLVLLLLLMTLDGVTHMVSDMAGIGQGFRDSNSWLAILTQNFFPTTFYAGDAWGSFNAWMRLITGILFAWGIVWFGFPFLDLANISSAQGMGNKLPYRIGWKRKKIHAKMNPHLPSPTL